MGSNHPRNQGDPAALNMYGALLEREGLFRRAAQALRAALDCLDPERDGELCNKVFKLNRIMNCDWNQDNELSAWKLGYSSLKGSNSE